MTTTATYAPIVICECRVAMHETNQDAHASRWHVGTPTYRYPTEAEVLASGWTRDDFTYWPYI